MARERGRSGFGWAAGLFGKGLGLAGWLAVRPLHLARDGGKQLVGWGGGTAEYLAGLVVWAVYSVGLLYLAGLARQVGWLTPAAWVLAAAGIVFGSALLLFLATMKLRRSAQARRMMARIFESSQQTEQRVARVEQVVTAAVTGPAGGPLGGWSQQPHEQAEASMAALRAEQARHVHGQVDLEGAPRWVREQAGLKVPPWWQFWKRD
jgi:hypothetical protein